MTTILGADTSFSSDSHKDCGGTSHTSVSRSNTPAFKQVAHTNLKSDLKEIINWLSEPEPESRFHITGLKLEDLEALEKELDSAGRRIRHDWDRNSCVATFKMPCAIHETGGAWLSRYADYITDALQKPARCGQPRVVYGASSNVTTEEARKQPDGQYNIRFRFKNGDEINVRPPRVILETSYTQDNREAVRKIEKYLCAPGSQIHAGIHVAMSGKITLIENFSASIAVYVRKRKGHVIGQDYLFEDAASDIDHEPAELSLELAKLMEDMENWSEAESPVADAVEPQSGSPQPAPIGTPDEGTESERPSDSPGSPSGFFHMAGSLKTADTTLFLPSPLRAGMYGKDYDIECRGQPILLIDENRPDLTQAELPPLVLTVYDFLRPCPKHPTEFLANLEVPLDLNWLREEIKSHLKMKRDDLRKAMAEAAQQTPGEDVLAHDSKRAAIDVNGRPKKMPGARAADFLKRKMPKPARQ
ncbi:hypothetical protein RhiJN_05022 [Ceratobasidium sp. AG-Ba]|nr:hypothetical protein RhiJN_05022 [Ceratobasidium sp. AG-Ba]